MRFVEDGLDLPAQIDWRTISTDDGAASADFPTEPKMSVSRDSVNRVSVRSVARHHEMPDKAIQLVLSCSPVDMRVHDLPETQRVEAITTYLVQQGFAITHVGLVSLGMVNGHAIDSQKNGGKAIVRIRAAYVGGFLYRVVASSEAGHHDDPVTQRFLDSFFINRADH